jgi:hypothetical protein
MPMLYKENRFVFYSYMTVRAFRTIGLSHHFCDCVSYRVGRGIFTAAGRFYHITNLTIKLQGWAGEWVWLANIRSDNVFSDHNSDRSGQHLFPNLRVLNIHITAHRHPSYKLLDVEKVLENVSDLEKLSLNGVDILPLRLIGALRGVRSNEEEQITENHPCIFKRGEGLWELLAPQ